MSAKTKLGNTPKDISSKVDIPMFDGGFDEVAVSFVYRTKTQYAEMLDENQAEAKKLDEERGDKVLSVAESFSRHDNFQAKCVLKFLKTWDLSDELTQENLVQLENEHPGSLDAFANKYHQAVAESRTKN